MTRHVAFLRGINVGGHRVKMAALKAAFEALAFANVSTFIASGNVVFECRAKDARTLERRIETHLASVLGFPAPTHARTFAEVAAIAGAHPFPAIAEDDALHVVFFRAPLGAALGREIRALEGAFDAFVIDGRELYWRCRGKISEVSEAWQRLDKLMKRESASARRMQTLQALIAAHSAGEGR